MLRRKFLNSAFFAMNMKRLLLLLIMLALFPLASAEPNEIQTSIYILNLGKFDVATGSFTADFYLSMKCDDCVLSDFEFMNGRASSVDKIIDKPNERFYRIQANLNSPVDLKEFPFDTQQMQIIIEDKDQDINELVFAADSKESGVDESIAFTGWSIDGWKSYSQNHEYEVYDSVYSRYIFSISISRIVLNSFMKTFLPVFFILLVVLFSFILDPDKITTRLGMAGSSLVASVMFHISIGNQIPPVGYLTFADKFMALTYFILLGIFLMNIIMLELLERKNNELVERIHRKTEYSVFIIIPLLYVLLFLFFI